MNVDTNVSVGGLASAVQRVFELAADKTRRLDEQWDASRGAPVFTLAGKYTTRGWTEWTQGFQYGCMILTGDALNDEGLIDAGRSHTVERMLPHVTHIGVHDHGFNNLSTYGNLLRLLDEGRLADDPWQRRTYENAYRGFGSGSGGSMGTTPVADLATSAPSTARIRCSLIRCERRASWELPISWDMSLMAENDVTCESIEPVHPARFGHIQVHCVSRRFVAHV